MMNMKHMQMSGQNTQDIRFNSRSMIESLEVAVGKYGASRPPQNVGIIHITAGERAELPLSSSLGYCTENSRPADRRPKWQH